MGSPTTPISGASFVTMACVAGADVPTLFAVIGGEPIDVEIERAVGAVEVTPGFAAKVEAAGVTVPAAVDVDGTTTVAAGGDVA